MYEEYSQIENQIELHFFGAGVHSYDAPVTANGEKLPFELFLSAGQGKATVTFHGETLEMKEKEVVLIPYDTEFRLQTESGTTLFWVAVDYRIFTNLRVFSLFDIQTKVMSKSGNSASACSKLAELALDSQFTNTRIENAVETNYLLYKLALSVVHKSYPKKEASVVMSRFEKLAPVLSHVGEKLDTVCPIGELAEILHMSEDAFYRYFKSTIGAAPKEYLISERLRRARILLCMTDLSVTDISKKCGYENPFYFSTLFHGKYGFSPSVYREKTDVLQTLLH